MRLAEWRAEEDVRRAVEQRTKPRDWSTKSVRGRLLRFMMPIVWVGLWLLSEFAVNWNNTAGPALLMIAIFGPFVFFGLFEAIYWVVNGEGWWWD